jgi:membrane glycosyltransferase
MACGLATAVAAWFSSPAILAWLSPTLAGLFLAVPLSRASGSARVGLALRRLGLLVTPEETAPPRLFAAREAALAQRPALPRDGVRALVLDEAVRATHYKWATSAPRLRGAPDPAYLTAAEKVADASSMEEALAWLEPRERVHVAGHQAIVEHLVRLSGGDGPGPGAGQQRIPLQLVDLAAEQEQIRPPAA